MLQSKSFMALSVYLGLVSAHFAQASSVSHSQEPSQLQGEISCVVTDYNNNDPKTGTQVIQGRLQNGEWYTNKKLEVLPSATALPNAEIQIVAVEPTLEVTIKEDSERTTNMSISYSDLQKGAKARMFLGRGGKTQFVITCELIKATP